jgi:hypothetical protein
LHRRRTRRRHGDRTALTGRTAERAFFALAGGAGLAKVAVDAGAPVRLLHVILWLAAAAAVAAVLLARRRPADASASFWLDGWRLVLALLALWMLPSVYGRLGGDGFEYYALLRSPLLDGDLDFANDFAGLGAQPVLSSEGQVTARTPIGMAVLWLPAFVGAQVLAWISGSGADGFGPLHHSAVTLASFAYGVLALALIERTLRRRYGPALALLVVLGIWLATPLHFYMTANPFMSHAGSVLAATVFVVAWLRARERRDVQGWMLAGVAGALMTLVRVQDVVLLFPALLDLALGFVGRPAARADPGNPAPPLRQRLRPAAAFIAPPLLAGLAQLLIWRVMYGAGFMGVVFAQNLVGGGGLHVLDVLFAARHGLFTWTPLYLACVLGWALLARRDWRLALACLGAFALAVLVNAGIQDWWGSHAFGQRRLLALTPLFALGLAQALAVAAAHPLVLAGAALAALALWNLQFEYIYNSELVAGKAQAVSLDRLASTQVESAYWRLLRWERVLPRPVFVLAYDNLKGVWMDEGPRSLEGLLDVGSEPDDLPQVIGHNWYRAETSGETTFRRSKGRRSWLRLPIRTPDEFELALRARSEMGEPVTAAIQWNGHALGQVALGEEWSEHRLRLPAEAVRSGFNDLALLWSTSPRADPGHRGKDSAAAVDWVALHRRAEGPLQRHY